MSYSERTCFMGIFLPHYLAGRSVACVTFGFREWIDFGALGGQQPEKHVVKARGLLLVNRTQSYSALSGDTAAKAASLDFHLNHFREALRPWR